MALFYLMAFVSILAAIGVISFRQPIYSAFCLILNMLVIAGLFAQMEAHFLAATQVIVYAGAIMVLVVFVIMLLSLRGEENRLSPLAAIVAFLSALCFLIVLVPILQVEFGDMNITNSQIVGGVKEIGRILYTKYLFPFEAASILIMAAIVGAVSLAKREIGKEQ